MRCSSGQGRIFNCTRAKRDFIVACVLFFLSALPFLLLVALFYEISFMLRFTLEQNWFSLMFLYTLSSSAIFSSPPNSLSSLHTNPKKKFVWGQNTSRFPSFLRLSPVKSLILRAIFHIPPILSLASTTRVCHTFREKIAVLLHFPP